MNKRNYIPGTECTKRRPTPTEFPHLRKWVEELKRSIKLTSIMEMTNINQQLEQNAELYISNIIQRTISQGMAAYGDGFVTLQATAGGAQKTASMGTGQTVLQAVISFAAAANNQIVAAVTGKKIKIANIFFTVFGEVNLTFKSDENAISGAMDFGAVDEPRGMVVPMGIFPMETVAGEAFKILASTAVQVSGYCNYYTE